MFFFFKQKTAYEMRISDWSSDVCSSDLVVLEEKRPFDTQVTQYVFGLNTSAGHAARGEGDRDRLAITDEGRPSAQPRLLEAGVVECDKGAGGGVFDGWSGKRPGYGRAQAACVLLAARSEEHMSALQSLIRLSYAVICL